MKEYYTRDQAMRRLGVKSINAFRHMIKKYPERFINVNQTKDRDKRPWYDKAALDKFAEIRENLMSTKMTQREK